MLKITENLWNHCEYFEYMFILRGIIWFIQVFGSVHYKASLGNQLLSGIILICTFFLTHLLLCNSVLFLNIVGGKLGVRWGQSSFQVSPISMGRIPIHYIIDVWMLPNVPFPKKVGTITSLWHKGKYRTECHQIFLCDHHQYASVHELQNYSC